MRKRMTKKEARDFRTRWARVNAAEIDELKRSSADERLEQLAALMASAHLLHWPPSLDQETNEVRARWRRLREAYAR
jgi:hypothetical protein